MIEFYPEIEREIDALIVKMQREIERNGDGVELEVYFERFLVTFINNVIDVDAEGGDHYMGFWEPCSIRLKDEIVVRSVIYDPTGDEMRGLKDLINDFLSKKRNYDHHRNCNFSRQKALQSRC